MKELSEMWNWLLKLARVNSVHPKLWAPGGLINLEEQYRDQPYLPSWGERDMFKEEMGYVLCWQWFIQALITLLFSPAQLYLHPTCSAVPLKHLMNAVPVEHSVHSELLKQSTFIKNIRISKKNINMYININLIYREIHSMYIYA